MTGYKQASFSIPKDIFDGFVALAREANRSRRFQLFIAWAEYKKRFPEFDGEMKTEYMRDIIEAYRDGKKFKRVYGDKYGEMTVATLYIDISMIDEIKEYFRGVYLPLGALVKEIIAWHVEQHADEIKMEV